MALGKYLYCISRCSEERIFEGVAAIGNPDAPVHTVPWGGLAVVVSDSAVERYEVTRSNMIAHERVIEAVLRDQTPLPMQFSTIESMPRIREMLDRRSEEIDRLLREMEGKVEVSLKILWRDERLPFEEIVAENGAVRMLRDTLQRQNGRVSQAQRVELGKMVEAALQRKRHAEANRILGPLRQIADRVVENPILLDRMIASCAFLVDREREAEFDRQVAALDEELEQRINFTYFGPLAPYSFVQIDLADGAAEEDERVA